DSWIEAREEGPLRHGGTQWARSESGFRAPSTAEGAVLVVVPAKWRKTLETSETWSKPSAQPKSLSHKCAPHDDGRGEVHEGEVVLRLLLPPDEQLATAVEPRGRPFDDPSARLCPVPARAALLAATANMRDVAATADGVFGIRVVVAFVQAEMLLGVGRGPHDARVQQLADRFLVRPIRRSEGNGDGHPGAVGEMMALGAG